jgi:glycine betaine/proline transport system substrate-binding protein
LPRLRTGRKTTGVVGAALALSLLVTACGGADGADGDGAKAGGDKKVTIGWIPWDEDIAVTHLWKKLLEDKGYEVELTQLDAGPVYAGMASGDIDVFFDGWLPVTHEDYWEKYSNDLEDLGVWYDNAKLTIAVPEYSDLESLEDLPGKAADYKGKIIGIEPGAGLTRVTQESVLPEYGLDDYELVTGSTPAMLAELKRATDANEPIIVTLWRPHWAYANFPIRDLEDPKGTLGETEEIHTFARAGFSEDFPEVAEWFGKWTLNDEELGTLEDFVLNQAGSGNEQEGVEKWLAENPEVGERLTASTT